MIKSFGSKLAELIYHGINDQTSRRLPEQIHAKAQRLLDQLNAISRLETLRIPPSNHLEKLKGDLEGYWSLRINKQWRIIFRWHQGDAYQVNIVDYH